MRPLNDIIIVTRIEKDLAGIITPEGYEPDSQTYRVLDCGPGHWEFNKFMEMPVKKGDIIFFVGRAAEFKDGDKKFLFARARDIIAVM